MYSLQFGLALAAVSAARLGQITGDRFDPAGTYGA